MHEIIAVVAADRTGGKIGISNRPRSASLQRFGQQTALDTSGQVDVLFDGPLLDIGQVVDTELLERVGQQTIGFDRVAAHRAFSEGMDVETV